DAVASAFRASIREHGPDSVAMYVSGQLLTEDYYAANKLMKGFIGSANIDTNSRLCMASSVAGHRRAFGSDTVPGTYRDLEHADLVVLVGSNLAWCHPVLFQRLLVARIERGTRIIVVDPRATATSDGADRHLAIAPGSDVAVFNGLLAHLVATGCVDEAYVAAHTAGFAEASAAARAQSLGDIARVSGVTAEELASFYAEFAATERVVTVYSQGVNQSSAGTDKVNAIINCHLATGRIGRPGMGPFSATGQPNAMGGRETGGLANMLAAHMDLDNSEHRGIVRTFWGAPALAERPGLKAVDLFEAVGDGRIKALWIMATNPVVSMPDADRVKAAIAACPFVAVSDVTKATDTAALAHVLLPATAWGEKNGTVTNSERVISRQRAFVPAPGEARPDWWQIAEVARRLGFAEHFDYAGPAAIFAEYAALTGADNAGRRDLDISVHAGIDSASYDRLEPFQWPQPAGGGPRETRFFAKGGFYTPDRRARFVATAYRAPACGTDARYPLALSTGRIRDQWHTMTRTGKTARLTAHIGEPFIDLHPQDAAAAGLAGAMIAIVESERGSILMRTVVTGRQAPGTAFAPMHWTNQQASRARVGSVIAAHPDPVSGQPELKHTPVAVRPFDATWYAFAVGIEPLQMPEADYAALARAPAGWRLELAGAAMPACFEAVARHLFGIADASTAELASYSDERLGQHRFALFAEGRLKGALFVAASPVAVSRTWATGLLGAEIGADERWRVLAGRPGRDRPDPGPIVCSCFAVGANEIASAARDGACRTVAAIGERLKAGTNCGSCRSEIGRVIAACSPAAELAAPA
ncbi:MAG: molybdopterin-dependent oxidoreductase, partial [Hyphomicrobiaceae bacterium]|nr:molybdopterin-dependent oxidoreductase [Hyphomicrobiaceae bacterium]